MVTLSGHTREVPAALKRLVRQGLTPRAPLPILAGVGLCFLAVTLLGLLFGRTADDLSLLFLFPTALLALAWGRRGGLGGALASTALFFAVVAGRSVGWLEAGGHVLAYLACGVFLGFFAEDQARHLRDDSGWFEMSQDLMVEASLDGYFVRLSKSWEECLGWTRAELMARPFREFIHPDDLEATNVHADALELAPGDVINFENRYRAKDGSYRWLLWCARSDHEKKYAIARDVTERKLQEEERAELLRTVEAMARTDPLTGLANRRFWDEELRRAMSAAKRHVRRLSVALIDLDGFKGFNDTYGHAAGDTLLRTAADLWTKCLRSTDVLARYGGEEFAVLLHDCDLVEASELLERLRLATPGGQTCSIGIAQFQPGDSPESLLGRADAALYEAKGLGRDQVVAAG